jgi:VIT1/CCC1 family predicted Fe2+/Mn2+ transporter
MPSTHSELHRIDRIGWLRAAVLGANDGILSTASLIVGVAASSVGRTEIALVGFAGLVAGAMSMAAGEYVSVSSQSDAEKADLAREAGELRDDPSAELDELSQIYVARGLDPRLAREVATQLMAGDALTAHARDELGISEMTTARPLQAAFASAGSFAVGAAMPLAAALLAPVPLILPITAAGTLAFLLALGALGAWAGGADPVRGAVRVVFWGAAAMALTAAVGHIFGATVA